MTKMKQCNVQINEYTCTCAFACAGGGADGCAGAGACTCTCTYIYICICIYTCICIYIYIYMHKLAQKYIQDIYIFRPNWSGAWCQNSCSFVLHDTLDTIVYHHKLLFFALNGMRIFLFRCKYCKCSGAYRSRSLKWKYVIYKSLS